MLVACLLLLACCCLLALRLPGEVAHFVKNGGYIPGQKRASSDERSRIGKLALLSRGPFFSMRNSRFGGVGSRKSRPKVVIFP